MKKIVWILSLMLLMNNAVYANEELQKIDEIKVQVEKYKKECYNKSYPINNSEKMDLEFNDVEVTPNLNKLAKEGMFFKNFYSPVSTGTSSDAEYMMLTGLLPSSSGTVFVSYANNIQKICF